MKVEGVRWRERSPGGAGGVDHPPGPGEGEGVQEEAALQPCQLVQPLLGQVWGQVPEAGVRGRCLGRVPGVSPEAPRCPLA